MKSFFVLCLIPGFVALLPAIGTSAQPSNVEQYQATYNRNLKLFDSGEDTALPSGDSLYQGVCGWREPGYYIDPETNERHSYYEYKRDSFLYISASNNTFTTFHRKKPINLEFTRDRQAAMNLIEQGIKIFSKAATENGTLVITSANVKMKLRVNAKSILVVSTGIDMACEFKVQVPNRVLTKIMSGEPNKESDLPAAPTRTAREAVVITNFMENQEAAALLLLDRFIAKDAKLLRAVDLALRKAYLKLGIEIADVQYFTEQNSPNENNGISLFAGLLFFRHSDHNQSTDTHVSYAYERGKPTDPNFNAILATYYLDERTIQSFDVEQAKERFVNWIFSHKGLMENQVINDNLAYNKTFIAAAYKKLKTKMAPKKAPPLPATENAFVSDGYISMLDQKIEFDDDLKALAKALFKEQKPWIAK